MLDDDVQRSETLDIFIKHVKQLYLVYRNCFEWLVTLKKIWCYIIVKMLCKIPVTSEDQGIPEYVQKKTTYIYILLIFNIGFWLK